MKKKLGLTALVMLIVAVVAVAIFYSQSSSRVIRYGLSPFQDTAMPVVAEAEGLYKARGLDVELVSVAWEDIIPSVASGGGAIDVGIGSINLLLPRAENIDIKGGGDVIFYFPLYVFKGAALLMRSDASFKPLSELLKKHPGHRDAAIREAMAQIKGKTVAVPKGTPYEQMLLFALKIAGLDPQKDIDLRYVKLSDALPAFLAGDIDICGAGVTQRTEAVRRGHRVFLEMEDLGFAEIIGLVTTRTFAKNHGDELEKLIDIWFESVDWLLADVDSRSASVLRYLDANASTKYSLEEYKAALTFQEFPRSRTAAERLMLRPSGRFYWRRTWDIVNDYLVGSQAIEKPIPYSLFSAKEEGLTQ